MRRIVGDVWSLRRRLLVWASRPRFRLVRGKIERVVLHSSLEKSPIGFWETVRIRESPETGVLGVASRVGEVYGQTIPSESGVSVVGAGEDDFALNVCFREQGRADLVRARLPRACR